MRRFFALLCITAAMALNSGCGKSAPAPNTFDAKEPPAEQEEVVVEETVEEKSP